MQRLLQRGQALREVAGRSGGAGWPVAHGCCKAPFQRVYLPRQPQKLLAQLRLRAHLTPFALKYNLIFSIEMQR